MVWSELNNKNIMSSSLDLESFDSMALISSFEALYPWIRKIAK